MEELEKMQNTALRLILGAPKRTRICNMQIEANLPPLRNRIQSANLFHLQKFMRKENDKLHLNINQALQQDPTLFTKKTWANQIAGGIKELGVQQLFLNLEMDPPDDTYRTPPPWQGKAVKTTTHRLSHTKNKLSQKEALRQATETIQAAPRQGVQTYYTDGSVSDGRAAAAFICNTETIHYRLNNGASILQAELVAIKGALQHALQTPTSAAIYTDSLAAIQTIEDNQAKDNVGLVTSI